MNKLFCKKSEKLEIITWYYDILSVARVIGIFVVYPPGSVCYITVWCSEDELKLPVLNQRQWRHEERKDLRQML